LEKLVRLDLHSKNAPAWLLNKRLVYTINMDLNIWLDFIQAKQKQFPMMQGQDVYKLLYQGLLGSEHLFREKDRFVAGLRAELDQLRADPKEDLYESVRPDGGLARINLQAWLALDLNLDDLVTQCFAAAEQKWDSLADLLTLWQAYSSTRPDQEAFAEELKKLGYPPVHHSSQYSLHYHPAYRLIMTKR